MRGNPSLDSLDTFSYSECFGKGNLSTKGRHTKIISFLGVEPLRGHGGGGGKTHEPHKNIHVYFVCKEQCVLKNRRTNILRYKD